MFILKVDHEIDLQLIQTRDSSTVDVQPFDNNRNIYDNGLPWFNILLLLSLQYHSIISAWLITYFENMAFKQEFVIIK